MTPKAQAVLNELLLKGYIVHTSKCGRYYSMEGPLHTDTRPSRWYSNLGRLALQIEKCRTDI